MIGDTTLLDIYEACGATVSEDRTSISFTAGALKPIDIVIRVMPTAVEIPGMNEAEQVTFDVFVDDELAFGEHIPYIGTPYRIINRDTQIKLPVSQVKILKEKQDD